MKWLPPLVAAFTLACHPLHSQAQPLDPEKIRGEIEALLELRAQARLAAQTQAVEGLLKQVQSGKTGLSFYEDAIKELNFSGRPLAARERVEWAKKNADMLQSSEFKAAAQLHLNYLALTLQRSGSDRALDWVMPTLDYLRAYHDADIRQFSRQDKAPDEQRKLLNQAVKEGVIAKANRLTGFVKDSADWEPTPGNLEGIYEKNLFMPLRAAKDPRLMDVWKFRIEAGEKLANAQRSPNAKQDFLQMKFPAWRFARAEDLVILGRKEEAMNEIYLLVKNYPQHPALEKWARRLLQLLKPTPETP